MPSRPLRLLAYDADDLAVVSTHLQDAVARVGDMAYLPKMRRFAFVASRFDWLAAKQGGNHRIRVGVHFDGVLGAATSGFDPSVGDVVLNLLSVAFTPGESPGGEVILIFSGGAEIRLRVECLDAQLRDMGPRWHTRAKPGHAATD